MLTKIQKWGNGLAIRIPKALAIEAGLSIGSPVELQLVSGEIRVLPVHERQYMLDVLLADITEDNVHGEPDWGNATGNELW